MKQEKFIIAVDQGSSGTMAALMDERCRIVDSEDIPVSVYTPKYGFVEHDPDELTESIREAARRLMARHPDWMDALLGVAVANQGESFLLWERDTGRPVTPVISWQDSRCAKLCTRLQREERDGWFHQRTGLHLSNEWPAMKLKWLREQDCELDGLCKGGGLAYGQLDAWFLYQLSGKKYYASDHSTACRSGFYNVVGQEWDTELAEFFTAKDILFPELVDNTAVFPDVDIGIGRPLPWIAGGLDQSMALMGLNCTAPQSAKVTYGTCCSCWMNIGDTPVFDERLTTSVAWRTGGKAVYGLAAEGGASGNIITWLQRNFDTGWQLDELSELAEQSGDQPGLVFVPAFNGIGAPYWAEEVRGTLFGVTAGTKPQHILRAGLDAIAYSVRDMLDSMPRSETILVDGGMTANRYLMKKQANVLRRPVRCSRVSEGTVTGVARMGYMSLGMAGQEDEEQIYDTVYLPDESGEAGYEMWKKAVKTSVGYYKL